MSLEQIITEYGYYAVIFFACIEGEAAVITAGVLASQGLMSIKLVCLSAFIGTWLWEQFIFFVGRFFGDRILDKYPKLHGKAQKVFELVRRYDSAYIFSFRFIYGIRNVSPLIIGCAKVSPKKYCILNCLAAMIWALIIPLIGYYFAKTVKEFFGHEEEYYIIVAIFILLVTIMPYTLYKLHATRRRNKVEKK